MEDKSEKTPVVSAEQTEHKPPTEFTTDKSVEKPKRNILKFEKDLLIYNCLPFFYMQFGVLFKIHVFKHDDCHSLYAFFS
jgi:hypothetical protein